MNHDVFCRFHITMHSYGKSVPTLAAPGTGQAGKKHQRYDSQILLFYLL